VKITQQSMERAHMSSLQDLRMESVGAMQMPLLKEA